MVALFKWGRCVWPIHQQSWERLERKWGQTRNVITVSSTSYKSLRTDMIKCVFLPSGGRKSDLRGMSESSWIYGYLKQSDESVSSSFSPFLSLYWCDEGDTVTLSWLVGKMGVWQSFLTPLGVPLQCGSLLWLVKVDVWCVCWYSRPEGGAIPWGR